MKTEVWFENVDGEFPSLVFNDGNSDPAVIVIPAIGEKVGIWQDEPSLGDDVYRLHYVVDVRHYVTVKEGEWTQEIHVMASDRR